MVDAHLRHRASGRTVIPPHVERRTAAGAPGTCLREGPRTADSRRTAPRTRQCEPPLSERHHRAFLPTSPQDAHLRQPLQRRATRLHRPRNLSEASGLKDTQGIKSGCCRPLSTCRPPALHITGGRSAYCGRPPTTSYPYPLSRFTLPSLPVYPTLTTAKEGEKLAKALCISQIPHSLTTQ